MHLYSWFTFFCLCSVSSSVIDLHSLESSELINIRKYSGDVRINQVVDNCVLIWNGMLVERLIECWMHEKTDKHLMIDLFVLDDNGTRRDYHFIFSSGRWTAVNFIQYHLLLRDLRINSKSLAEIQYGEIVDDDYDAYLEFNEIIYRNRVVDENVDEPSIFTKFCCDIVTCFM